MRHRGARGRRDGATVIAGNDDANGACSDASANGLDDGTYFVRVTALVGATFDYSLVIATN